ncbi:MAG: hypothetical protein ABI700_22080, partial [Chloroflexota bacterium]
ALANNPANATLGGTLTVNTVGGVATFSDIRLSAAGAADTLLASAPALTSATSQAFNVTAPVSTPEPTPAPTATSPSLLFIIQPTDAVVGSSIAPAITVELRDSNNALLPTSDIPITLTLGDNPANGLLSGTLSVNTVNGVATFTDLTLDTAGTGYTLSVSSPDFTSATSTVFSVTASAEATSQPEATTSP